MVRVSASYRPSSKVVGCGGAVWRGDRAPSPGKKYFLYTGSVVRVSASSSFIAVSGLNARPQFLGPTSKLFFQLTCFFWCFIMCILFSPSGECFKTKIVPPLVIEFHISGRLTGNGFL